MGVIKKDLIMSHISNRVENYITHFQCVFFKNDEINVLGCDSILHRLLIL